MNDRRGGEPISISVVVPCYNEVDGIEQLRDTLAHLLLLGSARREKLEIILVDDGSQDGTASSLTTSFGEWPECTILTHLENRGVGAAMRTGMTAAHGEIVTCYDADCAYPIQDLLALVDAIRLGCDVATATPFLERGEVRDIPLHRRVLSLGVSQLYRAVLGRRATSVGTFSCAFRAYRREVLQTIHFSSDGFPAASEILARTLLKGYRVVEVPSILSDRRFGRSKMKKLETIRAHLLLLGRLAALRLQERTLLF